MSASVRGSVACLLLCGLWTALSPPAIAVSSGFTYQGQLRQSGLPAAGVLDLRFNLFTGQMTGSQVGSTLEVADLVLTDGLFTVGLDFGTAAFSGGDRWLEIGVRPGASSNPADFVTLVPRQPVTPAPYSIHTRGLVVDSDDDVGMGTDAPALDLQVTRFTMDSFGTASTVMGASSQVRQPIGPALGEQWVYLKCDANRFSNADVSLVRNAGSALRIGTTSSMTGALTEQVRITTDGKVGIGTSSPSSALDVVGSAHVSGSLTTGEDLGVGTGSPAERLQVVGGTDSGPAGGGYLVLGPTTADNLSLDTNEIMARNNGVATTLYLNHNGGTVVIGGAAPGTTRLGIGTSSPAERLDLGGGNIAMGYQIVAATTCGLEVTVSCPAGKRVIGGTCDPGYPTLVTGEHPVQTTGWRCQFSDVVDCETYQPHAVYAICANIR